MLRKQKRGQEQHRQGAEEQDNCHQPWSTAQRGVLVEVCKVRGLSWEGTGKKGP